MEFLGRKAVFFCQNVGDKVKRERISTLPEIT